MTAFAGQCAVVTGGASGIGAALARRFAAESMPVVVADVEEPPLIETVDSIRAAGGEALAVVCDVSSWTDVQALRDTAIDAYGVPAVVCNNAGVGASGAVSEASLNTWEWCLGVNLWGVIHGCKAFLPAMIERGSGHIVNTASVLGIITSPNLAPYNVSKHGVAALSETLHAEMIRDDTGVGVTCLCPGIVATNIVTSERNRPERYLDASGASSSLAGVVSDDDIERAAIRDMFNAAKPPAEVADLVVAAIADKQLWLFTDSDFDAVIQQRHRQIEGQRTPEDPASLTSAILDAQSAGR